MNTIVILAIYIYIRDLFLKYDLTPVALMLGIFALFYKIIGILLFYFKIMLLS